MTNPILQNALIFWAVKLIIMAFLYVIFIAPNLSGLDQAVANMINIAYGFLTIFIVFAMKGLQIPGIKYRK